VKPETHYTTVSSRRWAPDDTYEVVEVQVFDIPARTTVRITVEPITQETYNDYLSGKLCPECHGMKEVPTDSASCITCHGKGTVTPK
jgi:DnaJ-class molecular chaperone